MKVSLARAHKIAMRIGDELRVLRERMDSASPLVGFQMMPTLAQAEQLRVDAAKHFEALDRFVELSQLQTSVREAIAQGNAANGVTKVMADIEHLKRTINAYSSMLSTLEPAM